MSPRNNSRLRISLLRDVGPLVAGLIGRSLIQGASRLLHRRARLAFVGAVVAVIAAATAGALASVSPSAAAGAPAAADIATGSATSGHPATGVSHERAGADTVRHTSASPQPSAPKQTPAQKAKPEKPVQPSHKPAPPPAPKPYTIYDSVEPGAIPSGQKSVAVYSDGYYAASKGAVTGRDNVLWIDVNGSNPRAGALDVEPGDATPSGVAPWVRAKLSGDPNAVAVVYTMRSWWPAVKADVSGLPPRMKSQIRYWIADPTGVPHIVPGADATQWFWGKHFDITLANPNF